MPGTENEFRFAIIGKDPLLEDELFSRLKNEGAADGSIASFDDSPAVTSIDIDDSEGCRLYLPLSEDYIRGFDAVFLLKRTEGSDDLLRNLAGEEGTLVLDLSGGIGFDPVPSPEPFFISEIISSAGRVGGLSWTLFQSASSEGQDGIRELFDQTVSILNFRKPDSRVFGNQAAFNVMPQLPEPGGEAEAEVRRLCGFKGFLSRTVIQVPVFHGSSLCFVMETEKGFREIEASIQERSAETKAFSRAGEIADLRVPEQRADIQFILKGLESGRVWGWARFDRFKAHADMAVGKAMSCLGKGKGAGKR